MYTGGLFSCVRMKSITNPPPPLPTPHPPPQLIHTKSTPCWDLKLRRETRLRFPNVNKYMYKTRQGYIWEKSCVESELLIKDHREKSRARPYHILTEVCHTETASWESWLTKHMALLTLFYTPSGKIPMHWLWKVILYNIIIVRC
jgi:hypothetical protein